MTKKEIDQKIREARRVAAREWRKKNPKRAKQIQRDYWLRRATALESQSKTEGSRNG